jgi:hypothetical protein
MRVSWSALKAMSLLFLGVLFGFNNPVMILSILRAKPNIRADIDGGAAEALRDRVSFFMRNQLPALSMTRCVGRQPHATSFAAGGEHAQDAAAERQSILLQIQGPDVAL